MSESCPYHGSWWHFFYQGWGLLSKIHVKFYVSQQEFSNMASDWLVAVLPANQMPGLKIFVN